MWTYKSLFKYIWNSFPLTWPFHLHISFIVLGIILNFHLLILLTNKWLEITLSMRFFFFFLRNKRNHSLLFRSLSCIINLPEWQKHQFHGLKRKGARAPWGIKKHIYAHTHTHTHFQYQNLPKQALETCITHLGWLHINDKS